MGSQINNDENSKNRIKRLDADVVNKIAAGEVIIRPANGLKELIENSIDAKSTLIDILVKDGGFKLLQISDNGCGINKDDLEILCERFATSKLEKYEDLNSIATYGFRGEALASLSHISHLSVLTKTEESPLAYKAYYLDGALSDMNFKKGSTSIPKPTAGKNGTQVTIEDLFYNSPFRLKSFTSKNEEYIKILDVVGCYAIHSDGVGFSCKRYGESFQALVTRPQMSLSERIRIVHGKVVADALIEFDLGLEDLSKGEESHNSNNYGLIRLKGAITGSDYSSKKRLRPILFVNNRLVDCASLRRSLRNIFSVCLPKGTQPFAYISLDIIPSNVDVNIHPTKSEVIFLNEVEIISKVGDIVQGLLSESDNTRSFSVGSRPIKLVAGSGTNSSTKDRASVVSKKRENELVRVDFSQSKLGQYYSSSKSIFSAEENSSSVDVDKDSTSIDTIQTDARQEDDNCTTIVDTPHSKPSNKEYVEVSLQSISNLKKAIADTANSELTKMISEAVFVGIVDPSMRLCCFQYDVKLILCDYAGLLSMLYYQLALSEFSNYGIYRMGPVLTLDEILFPLYENESTKEKLTSMEEVILPIISMKQMLREYFQIEIETSDSGKYVLRTIPMIHEKIQPVTSKLPFFIYRLGTHVNFEIEEKCIDSILREISLLYVPEPISIHSYDISDEEIGIASQQLQDNITKKENLNVTLENIIFPLLKRRFIATNEVLEYVHDLADLPGLYRVFERC